MPTNMETVREKYREDDVLPQMEVVHLIEHMSYEERIAYKRRMLSEISDREYLVHMVNDVNEAEGHTEADEAEYTEYDHESNIVRGEN